MRKALAARLEEGHIGLSYLTSGIYMANYRDNVILTKAQQEEEISLLDPKDLARAVSEKLLDRKSCVSLREFVQKHEWDAYADFDLTTAEPSFYRELI